LTPTLQATSGLPRASAGAAPTQDNDALAVDNKDRERKNEALLAENKALNAKNENLLAENKALLAENKALNAENKALGVQLGEAQDAGNALLASRFKETIERNDKAIEDNRKAIERNDKAIEDNRKAIEDNRLLVKSGVQLDRPLYGLVKGCTLQPIPWKGEGDDPRMRVATLPEGRSWLTLNSSLLFVRSCYDALWDELDRLYKASQAPGSNQVVRVLLLGTPGIGKTVSMNYFLHRALNAGYKVLFETRERRFYFHDGIVESELLEARVLSSVHGDPAVFFLVDHQQSQPPPFVEAFTVAAMSPDQRNFKEFIKNRCMPFFVPLPSAHEVIAMNSVWPQLSTKELQSRLERYGPIPRRVFSPLQSYHQTDLISKLKSFDYQVVLTMGLLTKGSFLPKQFEGLSWTVLHLTTEDFQSVSAITWASRSVMQEAMALHYAHKLGELEQIIAKGLANPARLHDVDGEFQYWACHKLAAGGKWPMYAVKFEQNTCCYIKSGDLQLPRSEVQLVSRLPPVSTMMQRPGQLHYSKLPNEPLCDAAMVEGTTLLLFQMTIGETHSFKPRRWNELCSEAEEAGLMHVRFIYVVPHQDCFRVSRDQVQLFESARTQQGLQKTLEVLVIQPKIME
jgi:hypothetical protein